MTISEHIKTILAEQYDAEDVANERRLVEDIGLDSLDIIDLSIEIEEQLDVPITDDAMRQVVTVGDLVSLVESLTVKERAS